jgi:hypothetical protein
MGDDKKKINFKKGKCLMPIAIYFITIQLYLRETWLTNF